MISSRPSSPPPDLGSLSAVLTPPPGERRTLQVGVAVAAALHAAIFAITWPTLAGGERVVATTRPEIFVVRVYEFTPPDRVALQLPQPPRRILVIPDASPDAPEPELRDVDPVVAMPADTDWIPVPVIAPPPEDVDPNDPVVAGVEVEAPRILDRVEPRYPESARAARRQGAVVLELLIDERGGVADVTVLRGLPLGLTESAVEAVRRWRFEPSTLRGRPVAVRYTLTVHFRLE